jgi:MinD-like ATPase involved in chromosome partitioning or flagellar assembly
LYVITFYSFKGGVGRTMALVNVAAELARRGRKVLVVDFDLEAPGLETYKHLRPQKPNPGIVEYVTEYRRTNAVPHLLDYIYEAKAKPIGKKGGRLWVMPAGRRDRAYRNALANLDWQRLYAHEEGFLLFEDTKEGWKQELKPDYVLIDSRTGDTDVLGICTRQLPDAVVLMFTPNEQNLAGLENVVRDIRREETEGLKKTIRLHFVAANVPDLDDEKGILRRQAEAFRKRLGIRNFSGVIRRYENLSLLDQSVFTIDRPHTRLARSYQRLLRTLRKDNPADRKGALMFLEDSGPWTFDENERVQLQQEYINHLHKIAGHFNDDIEILDKVGTSFVQEKDYRSAIQVFDRMLQLNPGNAHVLKRLASCKANLGEVDAASENMPEGGG